MYSKIVATSVRHRDQQRRILMPQHPLQGRAVALDDGVEHPLRSCGRSSPARFSGVCFSSFAHIIGVERQRDHRGHQNRHGQRDRELAEQPPTMSPMNSSGISTAISETVSDRIVKPICSEPFSAASSGVSPSSM